jgi:uncharacterized protein (DUF1330 family)
MAAYVYVELTIVDREGFQEYIQKAASSIAAYGGKYIIRGRLNEELEGTWPSQILVLLEFPSIQQAKQWWGSQEYAEAKEIRHKTARSKISLFEAI